MWMFSFFDSLVGLLLLWLAWGVLASKDLFRSVVLFIVFGLLMSMAWVRLMAPDIALAEAAIGTGLTGVLLLDAVGFMSRGSQGRKEVEGEEKKKKKRRLVESTAIRCGFVAFLIAFGAILVRGVMSLPGDGGLAGHVEANMEISGVIHPVTAVLLNFRGYDTLLEIGVLLLAVFGVYSVGRSQPPSPALPRSHPMLSGLTGLLIPLMILMGGYLFWVGAYAPGGAFQAGAILGAAGVLLYLNGIDLPGRDHEWIYRFSLVLGFGLFLGVAVSLVGSGNRLLEYPRHLAGSLIVLIEAALTLSIALVLVELYRSSSSSGESPIFTEMRKDE